MERGKGKTGKGKRKREKNKGTQEKEQGQEKRDKGKRNMEKGNAKGSAGYMAETFESSFLNFSIKKSRASITNSCLSSSDSKSREVLISLTFMLF